MGLFSTCNASFNNPEGIHDATKSNRWKIFHSIRGDVNCKLIITWYVSSTWDMSLKCAPSLLLLPKSDRLLPITMNHTVRDSHDKGEFVRSPKQPLVRELGSFGVWRRTNTDQHKGVMRLVRGHFCSSDDCHRAMVGCLYVTIHPRAMPSKERGQTKTALTAFLLFSLSCPVVVLDRVSFDTQPFGSKWHWMSMARKTQINNINPMS